ncbi:MAG TPA: tRNA (adenosine(37)-N6)-threonylcarbamoyltransferase complex dimerization subunit type 1 TsaB [Clostridia bacterium]|nr:tRNA (adenosine(37)-N6)-threonylcarbamoyltransferase complex dimerization subunit type 1 TsaB [Clostridia bacterium]
MLVLALDSATNVASCAVVKEDNILVEFTLNTSKTHSERLMPLLSQALDYADLTLEEIDGFSVSIGPGSFTGLRIGLATIKALAFFTQKPLVGISTLDGLAANLAHASGLICPILTARRNELYSALYLNSPGGQERISEYMVISPEKLVSFFAKLRPEEITFLGDGTSMLPNNLQDVLGPGCVTASELDCLARAASIGFLGLKRLKKGEHDDINSLSPFYIKASAAEDRLRQKTMTCEGEGNG